MPAATSSPTRDLHHEHGAGHRAGHRPARGAPRRRRRASSACSRDAPRCAVRGQPQRCRRRARSRRTRCVRPSRVTPSDAVVAGAPTRHRLGRRRPAPARRRTGRAPARSPARRRTAARRNAVHAGSPSRQPVGHVPRVDDGAGGLQLEQRVQRRGGEDLGRRRLGARSARRSSRSTSPVSSRPATHVGVGEQRPQERDVGRHARARRCRPSAASSRRSAASPVGAPGDDLGQHRVVVRADDGARAQRRVHPDARRRSARRSASTVPPVGRKPRAGSSA